MSKKPKNQPKKKYKVDILTTVYGGLPFLERLAQSLLYDVDAGVDFHWIVIDDYTPPERGQEEVWRYLRQELKPHEDVTVVESKVNGGFSKANNLAASKGRAPYILLLNSDIILHEDGWLARMVEAMDTHPMVGVVGARLLFFERDMIPPDVPMLEHRTRPYGKVQHAGVAFNLLGQPYHIFMGWSRDHKKVMERRVMRAVTGACLLTRRQLWRKMRGLAEIYTVGNFEDVEYCVQLMARGNIILYEPEVCMYHFGSGSDNTETSIKNQQVFQLRNRHLLDWDECEFY